MRSPRRLVVLFVALVAVAAACTDERPEPTSRVPTETPQGSPSPEPSPGESKEEADDGDPKGDEKKDGPELVEVPGGATLTSLPDKAAEVCAKGPPASRACPTLAPLVKGTNYLVDAFGRPGGRFQVVEMAAGAPSDDFSRNAPPRVAHVVVEAGPPKFLILGEATGEAPLTSVLGQQLDAPMTVTLERSWGWDTKLVLAPSFPGGGAHGDHLVYRRTKGGTHYVLSLHAWEPAGEAVRTLHRMVRSIETR